MKVVLSGNLMRFASFEKEVEIEATTVGQAIDVLDHGGRDLALEPRDELGVLTAIAGG